MTLPSIFSTREEYLMLAINEAAMAIFQPAGFDVPLHLVKVSCGWPVGSRGAKKVMGQCFHPKASKSGFIEIFISPVIDDAEQALGVLVHELVHAVVGNEAGHGPVFKRCAHAIGLTNGPMRSAMPGAELASKIKAMITESLGAYPHAAVDFSNRKKQGTRMILLRCPVSGYQVRTTQRWIMKGLPTSPAGHLMEVVG
jgi:hypothetical protein